MDLYSPFDKALEALDVADLSVLYSVPEGWYIEYKRETVLPKDLAKAVAAFANTHGGWLFLGVDEGSDGEPTAAEFPGIDTGDVARTLQWLRQSVNAHVSPLPYFESRVLQGPCDSIDLADDKSVVVIHTPQSNNTPHISSNGRVYVRVADSSEPQDYVKDRYLLDELTRRGDRMREATRSWVDRDPEFSEGEANTSFVRLMLTPDLWSSRYRRPSLSHRNLRDVLAGSRSGEVVLPFDSIHPTADGIVARQTRNNDPRKYSLTIHLYNNWSCDIVIPLNCYAGFPDTLIQNLSDRYRYAERFVRIMEEQRYWPDQDYRSLDVIDLNALLYGLMGITTLYSDLLQIAEADAPFYFKARLLHVWRKIPYLDSPQILDTYEERGVPMLLHDEITVPPGKDPESFLFLGDKSRSAGNEDGSTLDAMVPAVAMFAHLIAAFGITGLLTDEGVPASDKIREILAAAGRGINRVGTDASGSVA